MKAKDLGSEEHEAESGRVGKGVGAKDLGRWGIAGWRDGLRGLIGI